MTYALGFYLVTEREIVNFAQQWDPQYFHLDPGHAAAESPFGGLVASGTYSLAIYERLWVLSRATRWHVIARSRIDQLKFQIG